MTAWFNFRLRLLWTIPTWTLGTFAVYHYGTIRVRHFPGCASEHMAAGFLSSRQPEGLRVFAPLREPLILSAVLVLGNLLVIHSMAISSIYRLVILLAIEGVICSFFLIRMIISWRTGTGAGARGSLNPA